MAKFKVDFQKVSAFMVAKGERVALIGVLVIMVGLLALYLLPNLGSASKHMEIEKAVAALKNRVENAHPPDDYFIKEQIKAPEWEKIQRPEQFFAGGWYDPGAVGDNKVQNPIILAVETGTQGKNKQIQMDVIRAPVLVYSLNLDGREPTVNGLAPEGAKASEAAEHLARQIQPRRLVVVHATFPYKEQLEIFRKALRKNTISELFTASSTGSTVHQAPVFLGLNIKRQEILPDGKQTDWIDLYSTNTKGEIVVAREIKDLLIRSIYDEESYSQWAEFLQPGLATPLPALAFGEYPKLTLPDVTLKSDEDEPETKPGQPMPMGGKQPMLPGVKQPMPSTGGKQPMLPGVKDPKPGEGTGSALGLKEIPVSFKVLRKSKNAHLESRFRGNIHPFYPDGQNPDETPPGGAPIGPGPKGGPPIGVGPMPQPPGPGKRGGGEQVGPMPKPGGMAPETGAGDQFPEKKLIRFIDVDVQPGKTYVYSIQVRMYNPNFGNTARVQYAQLATIKELLSRWATTPPITVTPEFQYYVVDEKALDAAKFKTRVTRGIDDKDAGPDKVAIQIHTWVESFLNANKARRDGGDWGIAERLLLSRGEWIGRRDVEVLFPEWNVLTEAFEVGAPPPADPKKKEPKKTGKTGVFLNFMPRLPAPLVVDFQGGKQSNEESAVELLVLTPDGRLELRNSRQDTDKDSPRGRERQERHDRWVRRITELTTPAGSTTDPMPPGSKDGNRGS